VTVSLATRPLNPEFIVDVVATWFLLSAVLLGLNMSHRFLIRRRESRNTALQQA